MRCHPVFFLSDKQLKAGVLAQIIPLPDSSRSPLHSPLLTLPSVSISVHLQTSQRTLLGCLTGCSWVCPCLFSSPPSASLPTHPNSTDTAPHPKPYSKDRFFDCFSVCVSHFTQQEGTAPLQDETLLKCTWFSTAMLFFLPWRSPVFLMFEK